MLMVSSEVNLYGTVDGFEAFDLASTRTTVQLTFFPDRFFTCPLSLSTSYAMSLPTGKSVAFTLSPSLLRHVYWVPEATKVRSNC